jgi:hypothetical protein
VGTTVKISCRLWAKNIVVDKQRRLGMNNRHNCISLSFYRPAYSAKTEIQPQRSTSTEKNIANCSKKIEVVVN